MSENTHEYGTSAYHYWLMGFYAYHIGHRIRHNKWLVKQYFNPVYKTRADWVEQIRDNIEDMEDCRKQMGQHSKDGHAAYRRELAARAELPILAEQARRAITI